MSCVPCHPRYTSSNEACWRACEFDINGCEPTVHAVGAHLPQCDPIFFTEGSDVDTVQTAAERKVSEQTRFLLRPLGADFDNLSVLEYFSVYSHDVRRRASTSLDPVPDLAPGSAVHLVWARRAAPRVVRLYDVRPAQGQVFYLRKLLMSTQGARSYRDLATVSNHVYYTPAEEADAPARLPLPNSATDRDRALANAHAPVETFDPVFDCLHVPDGVYDFKAAAVAMGIVAEGRELQNAMQDAITALATPAQLRRLFVLLLSECVDESPVDAVDLLTEFGEAMSEDYALLTSSTYNVVLDTPAMRRDRLLHALAAMAQRDRRTLADLGLPSPTLSVQELGGHMAGPGTGLPTNLGMGSLSPAQHAAEADRLEPMVRNVRDQEVVYDHVLGLVAAGAGGCAFLDAPAGRGKSFLISAIASRLRGAGTPVFLTATTSIVANMFDGGCTAHAGFGLPVGLSFDTDPATVCSRLQTGSLAATVLRSAQLIVIDEITMLLGVYLGIIDRLLRTIMGTLSFSAAPPPPIIRYCMTWVGPFMCACAHIAPHHPTPPLAPPQVPRTSPLVARCSW